MPQPSTDRATLLPLLPEQRVGVVESITPLTTGLSGAGVYLVTASLGAFVLRVQSRESDEGHFAQQLQLLRRVSDARVAPLLVHVDEAARAVVSVHVAGPPLAVALAHPTSREAALASIAGALRTLHALDASGAEERDPLSYTQDAWEACRQRPGFPRWATAIEPMLAGLAALLDGDRRRALCHNDMNPGNILWDGTRAWFVDWEVAGLGHPYYDLATLALFLRLDDDGALALVAQHDGAPVDERSRHVFLALRRLAGLLSGLNFLNLVDDLHVRTAATLSDAPSLGDCYAALRTGQLDMQSSHGRASMGLALLALGCQPAA
jgi:thiamine kinase-like enzyme